MVLNLQKINEEGKDSSQSEDTTTAFKASEVAPNDEDEKAQPESHPTATPTPVETVVVLKEKPEVGGKNVQETILEKKPEEKIETQEEEKKQEAAKRKPENNPIVSFITSLMGQKQK